MGFESSGKFFRLVAHGSGFEVRDGEFGSQSDCQIVRKGDLLGRRCEAEQMEGAAGMVRVERCDQAEGVVPLGMGGHRSACKMGVWTVHFEAKVLNFRSQRPRSA